MSLVAIVGRPNVGKSTLFNRLVGERKAIVDATAGTTRDRHYGKTDWNGKEFSIIDTGGYTVNSEDIFEDEIRRQVLLAIDEADVILFLVEVRTGITDLDMLMADILRRTSKKVILVCNKVDNNDQIYSSHEFYALGLGDPYCISSMSGSGTGDLMDAILDALPVETASEEDEDLPHITIVGRPNVGKSSLTNALLGEERNIVTSIAGTTRDSIHTRYNKFGMDFYLVDTAGMRKKGKTMEDLEFYSVMRSIRAIENSDVCILMIDARQGLESQDLNIHNLIVRNRKGCVIVVNKWDLIEKDSNTMKEWTEFLRKKLAPFNDIPIIFTSVLNKQRIFDVLQTAIRVYQSRKRRIPTSELNDYMLPLIENYPPPATKGKYIKIKYVTQLPTPTPQFAFFVNLPHITIVGRPNVGKSSMTNALLGEERNIVTSIAGTTRDSIHTRYNKFGMDFYLVDTAGMRKKGKAMEDLEFYSVMRSIRAIENSDVCILMLDAQQGLESQDLNIHNLIVRNRKGCVIVVNKWDLVEKDNNTMKEWTEFLKKKLAPFNDIPIIFTSVLSKQRIFDVLQTAIRVYESRKRRISTSALNDFLLPLIENYPPPATKGKYIKIKYVTQLPTPTPQFAFFVNLPQYIKEPYRRFLENNMRDHWDFSGVPVQIYFRQK